MAQGAAKHEADAAAAAVEDGRAKMYSKRLWRFRMLS